VTVLNKLDEVRGHLVVKQNDLIQRSRHQMDLQEQKIILYMISKLKPNDKGFTEQVFSITEFCRVCGLDDDNGGNYAYIKNTLKSLRDRSIWVTLDDGSETTLAWINKVKIEKRSGLVKLELDKDMKPYLLDLQENFTQYQLLYTLAMRSQYSVRLYELLKSYQYRKKIDFGIDELKRLLFAENYKHGKDFRKRVLETATREINRLTDIWVTYELETVGRKFTEVKFQIAPKDQGERLNTWVTIDKKLNSKQTAKKSFLVKGGETYVRNKGIIKPVGRSRRAPQV
jgi:plasmid replication initiation protein